MILRKLFRTRRTGRGMILCYHGVARVSVDPWALFVTPEHFAEQMQVIRERFVPTSLTSLASELRAGVVPERAVVTTFDDGYANNLHMAYPILHEKDVPATLFVVSDYVGASREFWWDELEQILLRPGRLPDQLTLTLGARTRSWTLRRAASYTADEFASDRRAVASDVRIPLDSRMGLYRAVWEALHTVAELERRNALDRLAAWAGAAPEPRESHRTLTVEELVMLDRSKLVDIGGHSQTHLPLGTSPLEVQRREIEQCGEALQRLLGHSVAAYCYPFGSHSARTARLVRKAGYRCACTSVERTVKPKADVHRLPRFIVYDWDGDAFARRLETWLTS